MGVFGLLMLAWLVVALPTGLFVGRLLAYSSRHEGQFGSAAREAMMAGRAGRTTP